MIRTPLGTRYRDFKRLSTYLLTDSPASLANDAAERVLIFLFDMYIFLILFICLLTRLLPRQLLDKKQVFVRPPRSFYLSCPYDTRCCYIPALFCSYVINNS